MEYLPSYGASAPIVVPYICTEMYDGGSFDGYPRRKGWDLEKLIFLKPQGKTSEETESFLQSWMYYGILFQLFGCTTAQFDPFDFVRIREDGSSVITTERLAEYLAQWYIHEGQGQHPFERRKETHARIDRCFQILDPFVRNFCVLQGIEHFEPPRYAALRPEIAFSITILFHAVGKAVQQCTKIHCLFNWGSSKLLIDRMEKSGWCTHLLESLATAGQAQMLYYAYTLGEHRSQRPHGNCNRFECLADQIDEEFYVTSHRPECSGCSFAGPDMDSIASVLETGDIPLVICREEVDRSKPTVEVLKYRNDDNDLAKGLRYVAFSHVWADGLGNPHSNAIPVCQLRFLQNLATCLSPGSESASTQPCPWWFDTFCVPLKGMAPRQRRIAIQRMRETYQNADKTLALDGALLKLDSHVPIVELFMRVKTCGWMRRLWTFQEGKIGPDLHLQFVNGPRSLESICSEMKMKSRLETGASMCLRYGDDCFNTFEPFVSREELSWPHRFTGIWREIMHRSSTRRADETICLSTLLDIESSSILDVPEEDDRGRMIRLLQLLPSIPGSVLFQRPPRLSIHGFRWAPTSFLASFSNTRRNPSHGSPETFQLGPKKEGLAVTFTGFKIIDTSLITPLQIGEPFTCTIEEDSQTRMSVSATYFAGDDEAKNAVGGRDIESPAVICYGSIRAAGESPIPTRLVRRAVLVDLHKQRLGEIAEQVSCDFIALLHLAVEHSESESRPRELDNKKKPGPLDGLMRAEMLPEQQWLVY